MQLYMAIAGIALLFAVTAFAESSPEITSSVAGYRMMEFTDLLNENILAGNSSFVAYLPSGLCNATVDGDSISTGAGKFTVVSGISVAGQAFCPDGTYSRLYLGYGAADGYVEVSR